MAQWVPPPLPAELMARRRGPLVGRAAELAAFEQAWERVEGGNRQAVFIGSMNLDPRSVELNTEVGVVVVCEALAQRVAQEFEGMMREDAWRLRLVRFRDPGGRLGRRLQWLASEKGLEVAYPLEPGASIWRRLGVWLLSKLPIEGQL